MYTMLKIAKRRKICTYRMDLEQHILKAKEIYIEGLGKPHVKNVQIGEVSKGVYVFD